MRENRGDLRYIIPAEIDCRVLPVTGKSAITLTAKVPAMKIILYIFAGLVAIFALLYLAGLAIPAKHVASRSVVIQAPLDSVWATITDIAGQPAWRPDLEAVEIIDTTDSLLTWIEHPKRGRPLTMREKNKLAKKRYEIEIVPGGPFSGRWVGELLEIPEGVKFISTEIGEIHNPIFRTLAYLFFDMEATIATYQQNLKAYLEKK